METSKPAGHQVEQGVQVLEDGEQPYKRRDTEGRHGRSEEKRAVFMRGRTGKTAREYALQPVKVVPDRVRALHYMEIVDKKGQCLFCYIVHGKRVSTNTICPTCNAYFCFDKTKNHFVLWHSCHCDCLRGFT
jgi:hypothetical protein